VGRYELLSHAYREPPLTYLPYAMLEVELKPELLQRPAYEPGGEEPGGVYT
jgi:hypothetical protein